jgi:hypothetical protein
MEVIVQAFTIFCQLFLEPFYNRVNVIYFAEFDVFECPGGEMVDTLVLGTSAERRGGSTPLLGTTEKSTSLDFPFPYKK